MFYSFLLLEGCYLSHVAYSLGWKQTTCSLACLQQCMLETDVEMVTYIHVWSSTFGTMRHMLIISTQIRKCESEGRISRGPSNRRKKYLANIMYLSEMTTIKTFWLSGFRQQSKEWRPWSLLSQGNMMLPGAGALKGLAWLHLLDWASAQRQ